MLCFSLFAVPLGVNGRLCSMIVAPHGHSLYYICKFVLRFYCPVNLMRSVYITTLLLGRLSPLSG